LRLRSINIKNFKSLYDVSLEFNKFNVLIGKNNSGKTSIFTAIILLYENLLDGKIHKEVNLNELSSPIRAQVDKVWYFGDYSKPAVVSAVFELNAEESSTISEFSGLQSVTSIEVEVNISLEGDKVIWDLRRLNVLGHLVPSVTEKIDEIHAKIVGAKNNSYARYEVIKEKEIVDEKLFNEIIKIFKNKLFYILPYMIKAEETKIKGLINPFCTSSETLEIITKIARNPRSRRRFYEFVEYAIGKRIEYVPELELTKMYERETFRFETFGSGEQSLEGILAKLVRSKNCIFLIEEPEAHLHPDYVKGLAKIFERVVEDVGCQILVVTHSPEFIGAIREWDKIMVIRQEYINTTLGNLPATKVYKLKKDRSVVEKLAFDLGFSPGILPFTDIAILVEGGSDEILLKYFIQKLHEQGRLEHLPDLSWRIFKFSSKGSPGAIIRVLKYDLGLPVFLIVDGDPAGEEYSMEAERAGLRHHETLFKLSKPDILCYIENDVLINVLREVLEPEINKLDDRIKTEIDQFIEEARDNGLIEGENILFKIASIIHDNVEHLKEEFGRKRYYRYLKTSIAEQIVNIAPEIPVPEEIENVIRVIDRQIDRLRSSRW